MHKSYIKCVLCEDATNYKSQQNIVDRIRYNIHATPISDQKYIWKYIKTMRHLEYLQNKPNSIINKICIIYYAKRLRKLSYITGFQIPPHTCGKGLTIWHWGSIIINGDVKIGNNCTMRPVITIGHKNPGSGCPVIGDNVTICSGCVITGKIKIGDNVTIAPNTVVFKDVPPNCVVAGNPARIIKKDGHKENIIL